jgi:hypothetical protein
MNMAIQPGDINGKIFTHSSRVTGLLPKAREGKPLQGAVAGGSGRRQGRYKYWTKDEIEDLKRLAEQHVRVTALARHFNRSVGAVRARASKEGISLTEKTPEKASPRLFPSPLSPP